MPEVLTWDAVVSLVSGAIVVGTALAVLGQAVRP